jgi:hypothetical protein
VALGTSLSATVNFAVLAIAWKRRHGGLGGGQGRGGILHGQLMRVVGASLVLALVAWGAVRGLRLLLPPQGLGRQLALALIPVGLGGLSYLGAARLLRVRELDELWKGVRRRLAARRSAP